LSIFTVAFASPQRLLPSGARAARGGRNNVDETTRTDTDGQKQRGTFYQEHRFRQALTHWPHVGFDSFNWLDS
jgi:hypothetical protein